MADADDHEADHISKTTLQPLDLSSLNVSLTTLGVLASREQHRTCLSIRKKTGNSSGHAPLASQQPS